MQLLPLVLPPLEQEGELEWETAQDQEDRRMQGGRPRRASS